MIQQKWLSKNNITTFECSAIIGYWRCGASDYTISIIMGLYESQIKHIMQSYGR